MACLDCGRGFHALCQECECCAPISPGITAESGNGVSSVSDSVGTNETEESPENSRRSRAPKRNDELKDPHSTGRKRAAILFPLFPEEPCEWQNKSYCGGGKYPIIGCIAGKQENRHHGPDKNTLNNTEKNVHRICDDCHNIWHSQNDPTYDSYNATLKHEPRDATTLELLDRATRKIYVAKKEAEPEGQEVQG